MKAVSGFVVALAFSAVVIFAVLALIFGIRWVTADPKGKLEAREEIKSGSFRIAAYNHFFDLCASVQALEGRLETQYLELASVKGTDDEKRVRTNISGIQGARSEAIAQYNVDARKSYTIGQFKASDLPFQLDNTTFREGGNQTECVA